MPPAYFLDGIRHCILSVDNKQFYIAVKRDIDIVFFKVLRTKFRIGRKNYLFLIIKN